VLPILAHEPKTYEKIYAASKAFEYTYSLALAEDPSNEGKFEILTAMAKDENIIIKKDLQNVANEDSM